jgi:hypothetical protein
MDMCECAYVCVYMCIYVDRANFVYALATVFHFLKRSTEFVLLLCYFVAGAALCYQNYVLLTSTEHMLGLVSLFFLFLWLSNQNYMLITSIEQHISGSVSVASVCCPIYIYIYTHTHTHTPSN